MYGGSTFREADEDPYFSMHRQHMQRMNSMFQSPYGLGGMMMMQDPFAALTDGRQQQQQQQQQLQQLQLQQLQLQQLQQPQQRNAGLQMAPLDMFGGMNPMMFSMQGMMQGMQRQMEAPRNDPNSQFYSQSTMMSYSNTGGGQPRVYQSSSSTRQAPGGVRETKKSVRDSDTGVEKIAVGRHIGDRGHMVERSRNTRTGDLEENTELINLDEEEAGAFNQEFKEATRSYHSPGHQRHQHRHRSLTDGHSRSPYSRNTPPAIEGAPVARRPSPHQHQSDRSAGDGTPEPKHPPSPGGHRH